jgi:hypothetical protein
MKNRFFMAISATLVTGALLLSATAQSNKRSNLEVLPSPTDKPILINTKLVYLKCFVSTPVEFPKIGITNNTNQTVPAGKTVYWQANAYMKGSIVLSAPLAPGQTVYTPSVEAQGSSYTPKAWYVK